MKKESPGTIVPDRPDHPDFLQEESRIKSVTDFYMLNTIACLCTTFLFPPAILLCIYFLYKAKKAERSNHGKE